MNKLAEIAEQVEEVYERLQGLDMPMKPDNAEIMCGVFGLLACAYRALTAKEEPETEEAPEAKEETETEEVKPDV